MSFAPFSTKNPTNLCVLFSVKNVKGEPFLSPHSLRSKPKAKQNSISVKLDFIYFFVVVIFTNTENAYLNL